MAAASRPEYITSFTEVPMPIVRETKPLIDYANRINAVVWKTIQARRAARSPGDLDELDDWYQMYPNPTDITLPRSLFRSLPGYMQVNEAPTYWHLPDEQVVDLLQIHSRRRSLYPPARSPDPDYWEMDWLEDKYTVTRAGEPAPPPPPPPSPPRLERPQPRRPSPAKRRAAARSPPQAAAAPAPAPAAQEAGLRRRSRGASRRPATDTLASMGYLMRRPATPSPPPSPSPSPSPPPPPRPLSPTLTPTPSPLPSPAPARSPLGSDRSSSSSADDDLPALGDNTYSQWPGDHVIDSQPHPYLPLPWEQDSDDDE